MPQELDALGCPICEQALSNTACTKYYKVGWELFITVPKSPKQMTKFIKKCFHTGHWKQAKRGSHALELFS